MPLSSPLVFAWKQGNEWIVVPPLTTSLQTAASSDPPQFAS